MPDKLANDDMVEGYNDGLKDERLLFPKSMSNRSASYRHGWLNGRDDRLRRPRASARVLDALADDAMRRDSWFGFMCDLHRK